MARYLREYYTTPPRLMVQRISGEPLPMHQCYINLALIEQKELANRDGGDNASPSSLLSRLKVDTVKEGDQVALAHLFDSRKRNDGTRISPRRILIQGRAGVGKTTLCKKIVHDFLYQGMWQEHFNILLWIPLRSLKGISSENSTLDDLFHRNFFSHLSQGRGLGSMLQGTVSNSVYRPKVLLILDGLDEVSQEWNSETPTYNLLLHLLNFPQVIITSRPYGMTLAKGFFDLELEVVGFHAEQVEAYVQKLTSHNPDKAASILAFVREHEVIEGLVRIPIQLDAVCYSWDQGFMGREGPRTMTSLYETLALKLWQKDALRLTDSTLNEDTIRSLSASQIRELVPQEMDLIERLAFSGMYNGVIEFRPDDRYRIYELLRHQGVMVPDMPEKVIQKISFLHSSDATAIEGERSYHFLHLTFQEFLAAQYYVRCWSQLEDLLCLGLKPGLPAITRITPRNFLGANKYGARYDIMWRFVAGLFSSSSGSVDVAEALDDFFNQIEAEPRDILGPVHQRLLIHCLNEVIADEKDDWNRAAVETTIFEWTRWACAIGCLQSFTSAREFPDHILMRLVRDENVDDTRERIILELLCRGTLGPAVVEYLCSQSETDPLAELPSFEALGPAALALAAFEAMLPVVQRDPTETLYVWALARQLRRFLPQLFQRLLPYLDSEIGPVRMTVTRALRRCQCLPPGGIEALLSLLEPTSNRTCDIISILGEQKPSSPAVIDALLLLLESDHLRVRTEAAEVLAKQRPLTFRITDALFAALENGRIIASGCVVTCLISYQELEPATLRRLLKADVTLAMNALQAMIYHRRSSLASELDEVLLEFMDHDDKHVAILVVSVLAMQESLPTVVASAIVNLLSDDNEKKAFFGAIAWYRQPDPCPPCIGTDNINYRAVVPCVARCMGRQLPVSEGDFQQLQHFFESKIASAAIAETLCKQSPINWDAVSWLLKYDVSEQAVWYLWRSRVPVPPEAIDSVLTSTTSRYDLTALLCLKSTDSIKQLERIRAFLVEYDLYFDYDLLKELQQKPNLPEIMFEDLLGLLLVRRGEYKRRLVERLLRIHGKLHHNIPARSWSILYGVWQDRSWEEQLSCCLIDNCLVLDTPEGVTKIVFGKKQLRAFKHAVRTEQLRRGVPANTLFPESRRDRVRARLTGALL
jgi:hypothetical protein